MNLKRLTVLILALIPLVGFTQDVWSGIISDEEGKPLPNTTIQVQGTTLNISTNEKGAFKLKSDSKGKTLTASHIGFKTLNVKIENEMSLLIFMKKNEIELEPLSIYKTVNINLESVGQKLSSKYHAYGRKEIFASYKEGWTEFYRQLEKNILGNESYYTTKHTAYASFTVSGQGMISTVTVKTGSSRIERVVKESLLKMGAWKPAVQNGRNVDQHFLIQINFSNDVLMVVEQPAVPQGGYTAYYEYLRENLNYPIDAVEDKIEGKVYVQFEIFEDGSIHDVLAVKGIGTSCNKEAVRLIKEGPSWAAPMQSGHRVKQRIVLPISFKLSNVKRVAITDPKFPGGAIELAKFIKNNRADLDVPVPINSVNSTVVLEFIVRKNGNLTTPKVIQSLGEPFDSEAVRIYTMMPPWVPAKDNGVPINKTLNVGVPFSALPNNLSEEAQHHFDQGVELFVKKDFKRSIDEFGAAISKNPLQLTYYFNRAVAQFAANQFKGGCADLTLIKERDTKALELYTKYCEK